MIKLSNQSSSFARGFFYIFIILLGLNIIPILNSESIINSPDLKVNFSFIPHDPISINSDTELEVFPGSGTKEDPYVIEGYNITTEDAYGIYISVTSKFFTIRNCYIDAMIVGIQIQYVAEGTAAIINNTCNYNSAGIYLFQSSNSTVANNTCNNNNNQGIHLYYCSNSIVSNNTLINCGLEITETLVTAYQSYTVKENWVNGKQLGYYTDLDSVIIANPVYGQLILINCDNVTVRNQILNNATSGLYLFSCTDSTVFNNTCNNNIKGMYIYYSDLSTIANNTCSNNNYGLRLYHSSDSTVANNTFTDCGLEITASTLNTYLSFTVANNTVNGKQLGFYTDLNSTIIDNAFYGQLFLINCTDVTIRNQILNNATVGLFLYSCTNFVITNNTCNHNYYRSIYLMYSSNSTITNNTCRFTTQAISLYESANSTVANNTCGNTSMGIYLHGSSNSSITNNKCDHVYAGVYLSESGDSAVANNTFFRGNYGIFVRISSNSTIANNTCTDKGTAIYLEHSGNSTIANNTCNDSGNAVYLYDSDFCNVTYNLLQESNNYGVYLSSNSDNNTIHHNKFLYNNLGGTSQGYDDGGNNTWYDTELLRGNCWSDWDGSPNYYIDGISNSFDPYPSECPPTPPTIENISHDPPNPTELDTISIVATVIDPSGVHNVTLHYRVNSGDWINVSMNFVSSDIYSATIGSFDVGDTVEYFISAFDNSDNYNLAINDNSGLFYSFTISAATPEFYMFSLLLPMLTFLFSVFGLLVLQRRKK